MDFRCGRGMLVSRPWLFVHCFGFSTGISMKE